MPGPVRPEDLRFHSVSTAFPVEPLLGGLGRFRRSSACRATTPGGSLATVGGT